MLPLGKILPSTKAEFLRMNLENFGMKGDENICRFLANCANETGNFKKFEENLYYTTAAQLQKVFPSAFKTGKYISGNYLRSPEKLANLVYDDRKFPAKKLGNIYDGDGWKYRGRGAIQLTGRTNYHRLSADMGIDFISNPDLLAADKYVFVGAIWFWKKAGCDKCLTLLCTRQKVAGNYSQNPFGYATVKTYYDGYLKLIQK